MALREEAVELMHERTSTRAGETRKFVPSPQRYLGVRVMESRYPDDEWKIDEYLCTFEVALERDTQMQKLRREMHRMAREHRRRQGQAQILSRKPPCSLGAAASSCTGPLLPLPSRRRVRYDVLRRCRRSISWMRPIVEEDKTSSCM